MTISGSSVIGLLESAMDAQKARQDVSVAVLDKAQAVMTQQGEAMVRLLEESGSAPSAGRFEALA